MAIPTAKSIATSKKQAQLVIAPAGSGKTRILVDTIAYRIKHKLVDLDEVDVIVFTFTNNAADELTVRLAEKLESIGKRQYINKIFIGTIHGWCSKFLEKSGTLANTKVLAELERNEVIWRTFARIGLPTTYPNLKFDILKHEKFRIDLEIFYNDNLDLTDKVFKTTSRELVRKAIENWQKILKKERLMDFGSQIRNSIESISPDNNKKPFELFVDEYQDVNPAQVALFERMLKVQKKSRLIAVGDPRQAIYQWRGSDVTRILSFKSDFRNSDVHELLTNYRSRPGIIRFANFVANDMKLKNKTKLQPMKEEISRKDKKISVINMQMDLNIFF